MKIHCTSLGCPRNLTDTEKMMQILSSEGHEMVAEVFLADLLIVNTCGFLSSARKEGKEMVEQLLKEKRRDSFLIVTGCMIPLFQKELEKKFGGHVDRFLPPKEEENIGREVALLEKKKNLLMASHIAQKEVCKQNISKNRAVHLQKKTHFTTSSFAYVKIADGCLKSCSYCIIPKIRGCLKSLRVDEILREIRQLLSLGIMEIVLVAQDLGDYGRDRGEKKGLLGLLQKILTIDGDFWIRLLYLHPSDIDEELLSLMRSDPRICPYFDLPLQHVSPRILSLMRRPSSFEKTSSAIEAIRAFFPEAALRTSLMVGFPSETEGEFLELCDFVKTYALDHVGIFRYSNEKLAVSASLPGQISAAVKREREKILARVQHEVVGRKNRKMIGKKCLALVEKLHPSSPYLAIARSQRQAPDVDSVILINDIAPIASFGKIYSVEITGCADYDLVGQVVVGDPRGEKNG